MRLASMRILLHSTAFVLFIGFGNLLAQDEWELELNALSGRLHDAVQRSNKLQIAVLDFTDAAGRQDALGHRLAEDLMYYLIQQRPLYTIVERRFLDRVLEEQRFSAQPIVDEARAIELGKLISADAIVFGTVRMDGRIATITSKLIDTETAAVLAMERSVLRVNTARAKEANKSQAPQRSLATDRVYSQKKSNEPASGTERQYVPLELFFEAGSLVLHNKPMPSVGMQVVFRHTKTAASSRNSGSVAGTAWGFGMRYGQGVVNLSNATIHLGYREPLGNFDDSFGISRRINGEPINVGDVFLLDEADEQFDYFVPTGFEAARVAHVKLENIRYSAIQADLWYKFYLTPNHAYINTTKPYMGIGVALTSILFGANYTGSEALIQMTGGTPFEPEFGLTQTPINGNRFPFDGFRNHVTYFDWTMYVGVERGRFGVQLVGGISNQIGGSPLLLPYLSSNQVNERNVQRDLEERGFLSFARVLPGDDSATADAPETGNRFDARLSASLRITFLLN